MTQAIGIDLGTTYSCVGMWVTDKVEILSNEIGVNTTPSIVSMVAETLVGDGAKAVMPRNGPNCIYDAKRLIGKKMSDAHVAEDIKGWPFKVEANAEDMPVIKVTMGEEEKEFRAEQISALVLGKMKEIATGFAGKEVKNAVITVPAYFNDAQRQATKDAGEIAGLNVQRIINEPTAAAIAYGFDQTSKDSKKNVLIFDLGGGTFDVSLLTIDNGVFEVRATNGNSHLGGQDFDTRLMKHCMVEFCRRTNGIEIQGNKRATRRLRTAVEKAKCTLSTSQQAVIECEAIAEGEDLHIKVTRPKLDEICMDLFRQTLVSVQACLDEAQCHKQDVDEIVMVGGSSRIPRVQKIVSDFFGGKELNKSISPDEAVACGAAIQAMILNDEKYEAPKDIVCQDVAPFSLGVETNGGIMATLIPRGSAVPVTLKQTFTTHTDNQAGVVVSVYEGERALAKDNHLLAKFSLDGIAPAARGVPEIEVSFVVDASGILAVSAVDKQTAKAQQIKVTNDKGRLSKQQITEMIAEAERARSEDNQARHKINAKNKLEHYCHTMKSYLSDKKHDGKFSPEDVETIGAMTAEVASWLAASDPAATEMDQKQVEMEERFRPIMEKVLANMTA